MPSPGRATTRSRRAALLRAALGAALVTASLPQAHAADSSAVRIGKREVDARRVDAALDACAKREPNLTPARCLDRYFVPLWLLEAEAESRQLARPPAGRRPDGALTDAGLPDAGFDTARALTAALGRAIEREVGTPSAEQLARFRAEHVREFERPERIRIFRILLADRAAAVTLLRSLGKDTKPDDFRKIAREQSIDGATKERGGDLGFVWPDGTTDVPELRADAALYAAAAKAKDGEFVAEPVPEGTAFAVIWRRGTLAASTTDAGEVARLLTQRWIERAVEARIEHLLLEGKNGMSLRTEPLKLLARPENSLFASTTAK